MLEITYLMNYEKINTTISFHKLSDSPIPDFSLFLGGLIIDSRTFFGPNIFIKISEIQGTKAIGLHFPTA